MSIGFWICVIGIAINLVALLINLVTEQFNYIPINILSLIICIICTGAILYHIIPKEQIKTIENVKTLQIDTTYILNKDKVDTIYKVSYFKYEND